MDGAQVSDVYGVIRSFPRSSSNSSVKKLLVRVVLHDVRRYWRSCDLRVEAKFCLPVGPTPKLGDGW